VHLPSGGGLVRHFILVHLAALLLPLAGQVQVLQPSGAVHDKWGQHSSSGVGAPGSSCWGDIVHFKSVQLTSLLSPLRGHMHVLRPSPAGTGRPGWHLPEGNRCSGGVWHSIWVHLASLLLPLAGQVQVLHPSSEVNNVRGQQTSSSIGLFMGSSGPAGCGGAWHLRLVQWASLFKPLIGHMHVFKPSPLE